MSDSTTSNTNETKIAFTSIPSISFPITAIVLAAGLSRRMGKQNKLLLKIEGQTLIEKVVETVLKSKIEEIIVVLGHEAIKVQHVLKGKSITMVKNPMYQLGMTTSIQAGVQAASKESKGYMIVLGDLAQIEVATLNALIEAFQKIMEEKEEDNPTPMPIIVPTFEGKRGNPVIFSSRFRAAILQHPEMNGCKGIIEANLDCVITVEMANNHILKDIDTPEDYDGLINLED